MLRKTWLITLAALAATPAFAHDFWVQPARFSAASPGAVPIRMYVGHGANRERWGVDVDRVVVFRTIGPDGVVDRRSTLTLDSPAADATIPFARAGGYLLVLQSTTASSQLPALRFNDYAAQEGLTPIINQRRRLRQEDTDGREVYSRRAKAIVQIGPVDTASRTRVTRPVGLQLEIVPERHPMALAANRRLPVRIIYDGRPLAGALVKLTNLAADATPVATARTAADGRATFIIPGAGDWQMNVVWAEPLQGDQRGDFNTIFSSLTFATVARNS